MSDSLRRERLQHEGLLLEKKQKAKKLELRIMASRDTVRTSLDPYIKIEDLEILVASEAMNQLVDDMQKYHELLAVIRKIRKDLGGE